MSFWDEKETKSLFKELPFYNILTENLHPFNLILLLRQ